MIRSSFNCNISVTSNRRYGSAGWGGTHIEISSRFGWNFFTRIRHWDAEMKNLLPAVTKFRIRTVEYYHEIQERVWDAFERKEKFYPKFDEKPKDCAGPNLRMKQVIYRFPLITITNAYHTKLDEQRHNEFEKSLNETES